MEMLEAALALLCALGVGSLLWLLFGLLVRPARGREPWVVLPGRGAGPAAGPAVAVGRLLSAGGAGGVAAGGSPADGRNPPINRGTLLSRPSCCDSAEPP